MTRSQRIPMTSIRALTLQKDKLTNARRTPPVPQLTCRGKLCKTYQPDVVQCTAVGEDGSGGLEWACTAELPRGVRFGSVEVGCEGWDAPDDSHVLKGSCGLTYNLVKTPSALDDGGRYQASSRYRTSEMHRTNRNFWGGGGGGPAPGPGGGAPPPPYSKYANSQQQQGWRPGFWSGALAGAFATEAASRYRNNNRAREAMYDRTYHANTNWGLRDDYDRGVGGSGSWQRRTRGESSSLGELRESTGFGGTRNR
ncbi:hypothetical protein OIO90_002512 [Microbotryomycetes sp. JL221]|nr:hypothetical protein OIO90_002512 [Microbotryomycetes sp. JL221]